MKVEHLLIIRFSAMGDVAMTVPVVQSLAKCYPELRITMLSQPFARPLFENLAPNVRFMEADLKGEYCGIKGLNTLYRRLVAKNFTHIADLHGVLRSHFLRLRFSFNNIKVAHIDKHRKMRRNLVRNDDKKVKQQLPTSFENYMQVFEDLGFPVTPCYTAPQAPLKGDVADALYMSLPKREGEKWIGIAPFAAHKGKIYPPEKMEEVIRLLQEIPESRNPEISKSQNPRIPKSQNSSPKRRIFLFGKGKNESEWFPKWQAKYPNITIVSDHLHDLYEEIVLMSQLDVMISMDSANMHLASLVGTRVVSVWGATHPFAGFLGWNQSPDDCIQLDLDCRPCSIFGNKPCQFGDYRCLNNIKPEAIIKRITTPPQPSPQGEGV